MFFGLWYYMLVSNDNHSTPSLYIPYTPSLNHLHWFGQKRSSHPGMTFFAVWGSGKFFQKNNNNNDYYY